MYQTITNMLNNQKAMCGNIENEDVMFQNALRRIGNRLVEQ